MAAAAVCAFAGAGYDLRRGRIPNWLSYGGLGLGLAARAALGGWRGEMDGLLGALAGAGLLLAFFLRGGMGGGDVKLMAAVGALAGTQRSLQILLSTGLAGGLMAAAAMLARRRVRRTLGNTWKLLRFHLNPRLRPHPELNLGAPGAFRLPYAVAIALGTAACLLLKTGWR